MKIIAIKCAKCGATIYSRANHDFVRCLCRENEGCFIDGGQSNPYYRVGGDPNTIESVELELDVTLQELYQDWALETNKYGTIKPKKERNAKRKRTCAR